MYYHESFETSSFQRTKLLSVYEPHYWLTKGCRFEDCFFWIVQTSVVRSLKSPVYSHMIQRIRLWKCKRIAIGLLVQKEMSVSADNPIRI